MENSSPLFHYDPRMTYVAMRDFLFNGVQFNPGDVLPSDSTAPPSKVEKLLRSRFVRPDGFRDTEPQVPAYTTGKGTRTVAYTVGEKTRIVGTDARTASVDVESLSWDEVIVLCKKHKVSIKGSRRDVRERLRAELG